ncbi:MAG: leucine-rich repeat protein, partial [Lachnospiraceae bacterium]|nr:leucine-rich repeat protein [Lachnospiraceae bacterium]
MKKKITLLMFLFALLLSFSAKAQAAELTASGSCGNTAKWYLYNDGNLVISGSGAMEDYEYVASIVTTIKNVPWEQYRSKIMSVSIEDGITSIGNYAFCGCINLKEFWVPETVTSIGKNAFESCTSLTGVYLPDNVTTIGERAFYKCESITEVILPQTLKEINALFYDCTSLKTVNLPNALTKIGKYAFCGCTSLETVNSMDELLTEIDMYAFYGCTSLKTISNLTYATNIKTIGYRAFYGCSLLTAFPEASDDVNSQAFAYCSSLKTDTINAEAIHTNLYENCSALESLTFGKNVTTIPTGCWKQCSALKEIYIKGESTGLSTDSSWLDDCDKKMEIHINNTNTEMISAFKEKGFTVIEEAPEFDITVSGLSTYRLLNSNHCHIYTGKACQTAAVTTGKIGTAVLGSQALYTHYSLDVELTENNYSYYTMEPLGGTNAGVTTIYMYNSYMGSQIMKCCILKASPTITVADANLKEGDTFTLSPKAEGSPVFSYSSDDSDIFEVSSSGVVTAKKAGTGTITVYAAQTDNYMAAVTTVNVNVEAKS